MVSDFQKPLFYFPVWVPQKMSSAIKGNLEGRGADKTPWPAESGPLALGSQPLF